jgi:endonuclease-3
MNKELILNYLDELYPNAKCELEYSKDYEFLIAVMLSAQTTDKSVNNVTRILFKKYDTLEKLKDADVNDIANIIRPIGTFNKKSIFIKEIATYLYNECNGIVPNDINKLIKMPGIGIKTCNVVLSNLYDYPAIAVDTHVSRVSKRLKIAKDNDNVDVIEKKLQKYFPKDRWTKLHHQMVLFGRYKCKSIKPLCDDCKLKDICKYNKKKFN